MVWCNTKVERMFWLFFFWKSVIDKARQILKGDIQ